LIFKTRGPFDDGLGWQCGRHNFKKKKRLQLVDDLIGYESYDELRTLGEKRKDGM